MTPAREKVLTLQKPFQILKKKFSILIPDFFTDKSLFDF